MLVGVQLDGVERSFPLAEFEDLVRAGAIGPETPVRIDAVTSGRWVAAGTLALYRGLRDAPEARLRRAWDQPGVPWMTAAIVGVNIRLYFWMGHVDVGRWVKSAPELYERGEAWRLLTYGLLHGSFQHLAMNMFFLAYIGVAMERIMGWANVGLLFLVSVAAGGALSAAFTDTASLGASGGDFGFLAAAVVFGWRNGDLIPRRARPAFGGAMLIYLLFGLWSGLTAAEGIDNLAHIGGAIAGGLFMLLLLPEALPAARSRNPRVRGVAIALVTLTLVIARFSPQPTTLVEDDGLRVSRPTWWREGWTTSGVTGWQSPVSASSIVARTSKGSGPANLDRALSLVVEPFIAADAAAVVGAPAVVEVDGVAGRRVEVTWNGDSGPHRTTALVFARGWYTHTLVWDMERDRQRLDPLGARILADVHLPPLAALGEAHPTGGVRAKVRRARALDEAGERDQARALLAEARADAPTDPTPVRAALEIAAAWRDPGAARLAEDALAAFPGDTGVLVAAISVFDTAGDAARADDALDAALLALPENRALQQLRSDRETSP